MSPEPSSDGNRNLREPSRASSPPAHGEPNALIGKAEFFAVLKAIRDDEFGGSLRLNGPICDTRKLVLNYRVYVLVPAQKIYVRNRLCREDKNRVVAGVAYAQQHVLRSKGDTGDWGPPRVTIPEREDTRQKPDKRAKGREVCQQTTAINHRALPMASASMRTTSGTMSRGSGARRARQSLAPYSDALGAKREASPLPLAGR